MLGSLSPHFVDSIINNHFETCAIRKNYCCWPVSVLIRVHAASQDSIVSENDYPPELTTFKTFTSCSVLIVPTCDRLASYDRVPLKVAHRVVVELPERRNTYKC